LGALHGTSLCVNNKLHSEVKDFHLCPVSLPANSTVNMPYTDKQVDSMETSAGEFEQLNSSQQPLESDRAASQDPMGGTLSGYRMFRHSYIVLYDYTSVAMIQKISISYITSRYEYISNSTVVLFK